MSAAAHSPKTKVHGCRMLADRFRSYAASPARRRGRFRFRPFEQRGPMIMMNNSTHEFERLLGKAALALWSDFPRDVQESLFETAVAGDLIIRNHLASYLHDHHPKTAHPAKPEQAN